MSPQGHPPYSENTHARAPRDSHRRFCVFNQPPYLMRHLNVSKPFRAERFWLGWQLLENGCAVLDVCLPFFANVVFGWLHVF